MDVDKIDPNLQAMWDALGILGFDLDGQPTPAATLVSGEQAFREHFIRCVREAREDHDAAVDEVCLHDVVASRSPKSVTRYQMRRV